MSIIERKLINHEKEIEKKKSIAEIKALSSTEVIENTSNN